MRKRLDMDSIAKGLGARRRGKVVVGGGYFGAMQLVSDIKARFRVPSTGGRASDPQWTERRLVPFTPETLKRLEEIAAKVRTQGSLNVEPMQLAGLLLERTTARLSAEQVDALVQSRQ